MIRLDSPYIVKVFEVYYDAKYINIVTENLSGGDTFTRMKRQPNSHF